MPTRQPYLGQQRKLVIAFDIGTTYSGISYAVLDPGCIPEIQGVTRFPAQQQVGGDSKVPSVVYYDRYGNVRAIGAEAMREEFLEQAEDEGYTKAEWFKLHLRPKSLSSHITDADLPPLPPGKTAVAVIADFLRYMYECVRRYISETHAGGSDFWTSVESSAVYVLSLPNGWEGAQQAQIRRAAVFARLTSEEEAQSRIHFVTEGEASLHYCINKGLMRESANQQSAVIIVDAGGGTIDLSAYTTAADSRDRFEEVAPPDCRLQGSVFVSRRAKDYLQDKLRHSRFGTPEDISHMANVFDKSTKLAFRGGSQPAFIRFGNIRDKDSRFDIKAGQLKIPGQEVERLFQPAIQEIVQAVNEIRHASSRPISAVFMVGGFAASDYLFSKLQDILLTFHIRILRPDGYLSKAVADGAVSFYIDHFVTARVAPLTYGIECCIQYDPSLPEHAQRAHTVGPRPSGRMVVPHLFSPILKRGTRVVEGQEFKEEFHQEGVDPSSFKTILADILCYRGHSTEPKWLDSEPSMFTTLCTVVADTTQVAKTLHPQRTRSGKPYYSQTFWIVLMLGLTELKAQLSWVENGVEKRGPATVVYERQGSRRNSKRISFVS